MSDPCTNKPQLAADDGGPAFPNVSESIPGYDPDKFRRNLTGGGMTLRDYFAAKAMSALIQAGLETENPITNTCKAAYLAADAMLKARQE